jgi:hypothetical protein
MQYRIDAQRHPATGDDRAGSDQARLAHVDLRVALAHHRKG